MVFFERRNIRNTEAVFHLYSETDNADGIFGKKKAMYLILHVCMENMKEKPLITVQNLIIKRHMNKYIFSFVN